jgi:tetratricopeptide (TPR) repeat protein
LHDWHPAYWTYLFISVSGLFLYWRRIELKHLFTIIGLTILSLTALRYLIFPFLAAPLLVRYLPEISWRPRYLATVIIASLLWIGSTWDNHLLEFKPRNSFPQAAVEFIRQQDPAPQLFNYYDWGGYISWFAPKVKTFMDGRNMIEEVSQQQDRAMKGESWQETLNSYGVNTVIIPGMSETPGNVYPLAELLTSANDWRLVFADEVALVFVRNVAANERIIAHHSLDKKALLGHLVQRADRLIIENPAREEYWLTKANALQLLGDRQGAITAYRRVLLINPGNEWAKRMLAMGGD